MGLTAPAGLADDVVRAWAVLLTGAFLATTLWRPRPLFTRAAIAVGVAVAATAVWSVWLGLDWGAVELAVAHQTREALRLAQENIGGAPGIPDSGGTLFQLVQVVSDGAGPMATLFPALLGLLALAGLALAWEWYGRIAEHPLPPAAGRFRDFVFSDQLVWGLVVALALVLIHAFPLPGGGRLPPEALDTGAWLGANLLLFLGALYALRGVAVLAARLDKMPGFLWLALGFGALFVLPIVVLGLGSLGLADTWVHFRRRLTAP